MNDADVVVVGAGLGGLSAAAHLARAGLRVVVLERGAEPGGLATTFQRGPYRFEASLHLMDGVGPGEPNRRMIEDLGLDTDVAWRRAAAVRRERWVERGWDLRIPQGLPGAIGVWAERLGERAGIEGFFALAGELRVSADRYLEGQETPEDAAALTRLLAITARELLLRFVSAGAAEVLGTLAGYLALDVGEIAALPFALMMDGYHRAGSWYVDGGSRSVTSALSARIRASGGEVLCGAEVERLVLSDGRVRAAVLSDGASVRARSFVAAICPLRVLDWIPEGDLPSRYVARLRRLRLSRSLTRLSLGLTVDPAARWGAEYETWLIGGETGRLSITAPAALDPECAPPGHGVLAITAAADWDGPWSADRKRSEADRLVSAVERHLCPGLRDAVAVEDLSGPATYERYAGVPRGAVFGFDARPDQSGVRRPGAVTPIPNLWFAGGWVFPGAGQVTSLWSGRIAAREVLRSLPAQPVGIPSSWTLQR